jgi:hypothetical protein
MKPNKLVVGQKYEAKLMRKDTKRGFTGFLPVVYEGSRRGRTLMETARKIRRGIESGKTSHFTSGTTAILDGRGTTGVIAYYYEDGSARFTDGKKIETFTCREMLKMAVKAGV